MSNSSKKSIQDPNEKEKAAQHRIDISNDEDNNNREEEEEEEENEEEEDQKNYENKIEEIKQQIEKQIGSMDINANYMSNNKTNKETNKEYSSNDSSKHNNRADPFGLSMPQSFTELPQKTGGEELKQNSTPQHPSVRLIDTNSPEGKNSEEMNNYIANKAKTQQDKYNTKKRNEMESPIFSYYDTSQKYLIESLFQNDETKERSNFIKKPQQLPPQYDQPNELSSNPLMNDMNFNFFNQNMIDSNSNANTYATSPIANNKINPYEEGNNYINTNNANNNNSNNNNNFNYFDMNNHKGNPNNNQSNTKGKSFKGKAKPNNAYSNNNSNVQQQYQQESTDEPSYLSSQNKNKEFFPFNLAENRSNNNNRNNNMDLLNQNSTFSYSNQFNTTKQRFPPQGEDNNPNEFKQGNEEYIFEKFGKRGWQCEKCNNFNFESRTKCNRCDSPMQPKPLCKIHTEANSEDKKKKTLVERKGDWSCVKCKNLNFAFRQECNRCNYPKQEVFNNPQMMMPMGYNPYPYPNNNLGFNYIDYQNMINGNVNIYNNFNNKGLMYPNMNNIANMPGMNNMPQMNKMMYPNSQMANFPSSTSNQYGMNHPGYYDKKQKRPYEKNHNQMYQDKRKDNDNDNNNDNDNDDEDFFDNERY